MSTEEKERLEINLEHENIVSVVSLTSEVRGSHKNSANEGVLIEGVYIGSIDVGDGTVVVATGATFVGSIRAGKLVSDGQLLKAYKGERATGDGLLQIRNTVILGASSLTEIDTEYGDIEVRRGARILARVSARDPLAGAPLPLESVHSRHGSAPSLSPMDTPVAPRDLSREAAA